MPTKPKARNHLDQMTYPRILPMGNNGPGCSRGGFGNESHAAVETSHGHQVPDVLAVEVPIRGHLGDGLPVAAVQREGHVDLFPAPAADLEAVAAPAHVTGRCDRG